MPLGTIEIREGFGPLELSKGFSTVCEADPIKMEFASIFASHMEISRNFIDISHL